MNLEEGGLAAGAHPGDGRGWDAVRGNGHVGILEEERADGACVVRLHRQDAGGSGEVSLVGDECSRSLKRHAKICQESRTHLFIQKSLKAHASKERGIS